MLIAENSPRLALIFASCFVQGYNNYSLPERVGRVAFGCFNLSASRVVLHSHPIQSVTEASGVDVFSSFVLVNGYLLLRIRNRKGLSGLCLGRAS